MVEKEVIVDELAALDFGLLACELEQMLQDDALQVFGGLLTFTNEDGSSRTLHDVGTDVFNFIHDPVVRQFDSLLERAAMQFATFCHNHNIESGLFGPEVGMFQSYGESVLSPSNDQHNHAGILLRNNIEFEWVYEDGKMIKKKKSSKKKGKK